MAGSLQRPTPHAFCKRQTAGYYAPSFTGSGFGASWANSNTQRQTELNKCITAIQDRDYSSVYFREYLRQYPEQGGD